MPLPILTFVFVSVIKSVITLFVLLTAVAYTVWLERKVVGHMQNRWGPTRVGPFGLLQPAADGIKFLAASLAAHHEALNVPAKVHKQATVLVRAMLPNLLEADGQIEVGQG